MSKQQGFLKLRNGLREHIDAGQFTAVDAGVYLFLHLHKNWRTGICWTNQKGVATTMHTPYTSVKDSFQRLKDRGYIQFRKGDGSRANYAVLLIGDEPTHGVLKGCRLIGFAANNFDRVVYDFSTGEHPEAVLKASRSRPDDLAETVRWASSDRLVTVPLPDLQDFKTFKTLPDVSEEQDVHQTGQGSSVESENPNPSGDQEPQLKPTYFDPECGCEPNCLVAQEWCKKEPVPRQYRCEGCQLAKRECDKHPCQAGKQRDVASRWPGVPYHWIKICKGCEQEFNTYGKEHPPEFHSGQCQNEWRERKNAEYRAKHGSMPSMQAPSPEGKLAAFLDGE